MTQMRSTLVLSRYYGGFGNRLFLYIHALAVAMEHGFSLINLTLHRDAHLFEGLWANSWCRHPTPILGFPLHQWTRGARFWVERLAHLDLKKRGLIPGWYTCYLEDDKTLSMEEPAFLDLCRRYRWINLHGWMFRANPLVLKHREAIRAVLRVRRSLHPQLSSTLDKSKDLGRTRVCLHIRQGDFREWRDGQHYIDPLEYAQAAWRIAKTDARRNMEFWVLSDEPVDLTLFPPGTRISPRRNLGQDYQLLTEADFILGGISTFSRSAAFLGGAKFHCHIRGQKIPPLEFWKSGSFALID